MKKLLFSVSVCGLVTAVLFHVLLCIASYGLMYMSRHAPYAETPDTCCTGPIPYQNITLLSPHGRIENEYVNIKGWFFPHPAEVPPCGDLTHLCNIYNVSNNNATIIAIHGHGANMGYLDGFQRGIIHKAVLPFTMAGFNVLAIDLRNHGESGDAPPVTLGEYEYLDILAAVDWLRNYIDTEAKQLDKNRIGIYGESMGAATVLLAAASDNNSFVNAIACESSYTSASEAFKSWIPAHVGGYVEIFGFDLFRSDSFLDYMWRCITFLFPYKFVDVRPVDMISSIHCPIFISHGEKDVIIPFSHSGHLIEAAKKRKLCGKKRNGKCVVSSTFYGGGHVHSYANPSVVLDMVNFMEEYV